jgi:hypothetical protein
VAEGRGVILILTLRQMEDDIPKLRVRRPDFVIVCDSKEVPGTLHLTIKIYIL